jgi:predicted permease
MLPNYFTTALRTLIRNRTYTVLNVTGLAVSITACMVIFLLVQYKLDFDAFHTKKDRIYRVVTDTHRPTEVSHTAGVPFPLPPALRTDFPQLEAVAAIFHIRNGQFTINREGSRKDHFREEKGIFFVEPDFFEVFDFAWLSGNPEQSLGNPGSLVLTEETATRYFGNWQRALGQTVRLDWDTTAVLKVTGILQNPPATTDFRFRALVSYHDVVSYLKLFGTHEDWGSISSNHQAYVVLPGNMSKTAFDRLLPAFGKKYKQPDDQIARHQLQPLRDLAFDDRYSNFNGRTISRNGLTVMGLVGVFLLLAACINFINLATAQAVKRSREVGVRKALGGSRSQLVGQFLGEAALLTLFALVVSVGLTALVLPALNSFMDIHLRFQPLTDPRLPAFMLTLLVTVSLLAGLYPALVLSGFRPVAALKGKITTATAGGLSLRRSLVVVQFVISQFFIIGTLVAVSQMRYFQSASLGFNKEAIVTVPLSEPNVAKHGPLRNGLMAIPGVESVSLSYATPASTSSWSTSFRFAGEAEEAPFNLLAKPADTAFFRTYGLKLVAGRLFAPGDTIREMVVNETFVKKSGFRNPEEAIGKRILLGGRGDPKLVVGVVRDFHQHSLKEEIEASFIATYHFTYNVAGIKINSQNVPQTVAGIERVWKGVYPDFVYEYKFLDQTIADFYKGERQFTRLFQFFAGLAIFIGCLGLYGLVSFMAERRTKEIGIRKVLGASAGSILFLFSKEFVGLVFAAFVVSAPLAGFAMQKWLENYQYRIPLSAGVFVLAAAISLLIALVTVGYRSLKAAMANPTDALRSE